MSVRNNILIIVFLLTGICFIAAGIFLIAYFPEKFNSMISKEVVIKENSTAFDNWKNPPASIFIEFYFFNVTNYKQFVKYNEKPIVEEIGPYVYKEVREKENIIFSDDKTSISYDEYKTYYFDMERSKGRSDNDSFYSINIPIVTLTNWAKDFPVVEKLLSTLLYEAGENLFEKRSVNELLWGYDLIITEEINHFLAKFKLHYDFPKFALYSGISANGSSSGRYSILSGLKDVKSVATIQSWNDKKYLNYWTAKSCNAINGTDGTQFSPFLEKSSWLYLFDADICRSFHVLFDSHDSVTSSNIPVFKFVPPSDIMQDAKKCPTNACFCTPNVDFCLGTGVINVSSCKEGAPLVISQPHFYQADDIYINALTGIKPVKEKHQTSLDIEPNTGYVMQATKKKKVPTATLR